MKTKNLKKVGCISGASCTFWGSVDDGAKRRALSILQVLLLALFFTSSQIQAGCNSASNGNWSVVATWDCGSVPTFNDNVSILHIVTLDQNVTVGRINILKANILNAGSYTITLTDTYLIQNQNPTFNCGTGTVKVSDADHILDTNLTFYNLQWNTPITAPRTMTINSAITIAAGGAFNLSGSSSTNMVTFTGTGSVSPAVTLINCTSNVTGITCTAAGDGDGGDAGGQDNQTTTSTPGLPPLPPTMNLNVDTSSTGLQFIEVYNGKNYPGTDSKLSTCKAGDTCSFTLETASWVLLKPFATPGYQFDNQWGGSQYCNNGNPFMISNMTCKPYFKVLSPELPTGLSANAVSDNQIDLTWRDNSTRETGYLVERSSDQTIWTTLARTVANTISYSDLNLTCDTTYYYRVTVYNSSGQSAPSNIANAITVVCPVPPPVIPPVVDPVPPPVVPPAPPVTDPTPPAPPATDPTPPATEPPPPVEPPVTQPTETPTIPQEKPVEVTPPVETTSPVENTPIPTEPTPEPAPVEPLPPETVETPTNLQLAEKPPVAEGPCPTDRHYNIHLDEACDAEGKTIEHFKVVYGGSLANAIITGMLTSDEGLVSNLTLEPTAVLEGGYVTNFIINNGLMKNFTFVGRQIKGGTLAGEIIIASKVSNEICDVILAPGTVIQGKVGNEFAVARLCGKITGDPTNPAKLENVTIEDGTELENVILGEGVILGQNVTQKNVVMACTQQRANGKGFDQNGSPFDDDQTCFAVHENAIALTINSASDWLEQPAEQLFVVIQGQKAFMFTNQWQEWNGELATLESGYSLDLKAVQTLVLPDHSQFTGNFKLYAGVRLTDGTVLYHQVQ